MLGLLHPPENGVNGATPMSDKSTPLRAAAPRDSIAFSRKPFYEAKAVGSFLPSLTTKALQKYGFSAASLIMDWPAIVGREFAQWTAPERLKWPRATSELDEDDATARPKRAGAVLVLRVDSAKALDVQYRAHLDTWDMLRLPKSAKPTRRGPWRPRSGRHVSGPNP
jgi:hypothetical protein